MRFRKKRQPEIDTITFPVTLTFGQVQLLKSWMRRRALAVSMRFSPHHAVDSVLLDVDRAAQKALDKKEKRRGARKARARDGS